MKKVRRPKKEKSVDLSKTDEHGENDWLFKSDYRSKREEDRLRRKNLSDKFKEDDDEY
jgi:hypothetical protein